MTVASGFDVFACALQSMLPQASSSSIKDGDGIPHCFLASLLGRLREQLPSEVVLIRCGIVECICSPCVPWKTHFFARVMMSAFVRGLFH